MPNSKLPVALALFPIPQSMSPPTCSTYRIVHWVCPQIPDFGREKENPAAILDQHWNQNWHVLSLI